MYPCCSLTQQKVRSLFEQAKVSLCAPAENFNWCVVPKHGQDAVLFAGVALLAACLFSGPFFALAVLLAGGPLAHTLSSLCGTVRSPSACAADAGLGTCAMLQAALRWQHAGGQPALAWSGLRQASTARRRAGANARLPHQLRTFRQCAGAPDRAAAAPVCLLVGRCDALRPVTSL